MRKPILALVLPLLLAIGGCAVVNRGVFPDAGSFPPPYESRVQFVATAEQQMQYEILGEGYGESSGHALLLGGLLYMKQPDIMFAYQQAVASRNGDVLLDARTQTEVGGFLSPLLYTKGTFRIWGLVARIKDR